MGLTKDNKKFNIIAEFLIAFLGVWASLEIFLSAFQVELMDNVYVLYCLSVTGILYGVFKYVNGKMFKIVLGVIGIAAVIVGVVCSALLQFGIRGLINAMDIGIKFNEYIAYDFLLCYIGCIIAVVITVLVVKSKAMWAVVCLLPGFIPCAICGGMPSAFSLTLAFLFIIGASIYNKGNAVYTLGIFIAIVIVYVAVIFVFPAHKHEKNNWFNKFQEYFKEDEVKENIKYHGGIGGGVIGDVDKVEFADIKLMTLKTGYKGNVYLRSFTAATYGNNSWNKLDESVYDRHKDAFDMTYYMINSNNQQAKLFSIIDNDGDIATELFGSVEQYFNNVLNRKYSVKYEAAADKAYWYMPYGNQYSVSKKSEKDGYPLFCERGAIEAGQYIYISSDYDKISEYIHNYKGNSQGLKDYIAWEKKYRKFVKDAYTGVDTKVKASINNAKVEVPKAQDITTTEGTLAYAALLEKYFEDNFTYTLAPGAVPEGKDFVEYFLSESNKGYCTYYATAATLILRNEGIPARYVEGYVVDTSSGATAGKESKRESKEFTTIDKYTERTVDVYDNCAHAWVEIYVNGYGWIPYEFTPGYRNDNMTSGEDIAVEDSTKADEENSDIHEDEETQEEKQDIPPVPEPKEYSNLREYLADNKILDFDAVFYFMWLDFLKILIFLFKVALVLAILCIMVYIPSYISTVKKRRLFRYYEDSTPDKTNKQVMEIYMYLEKLCRFLKVKRTDTMSGEEYVRVMKAKYEYFQEAEVEHIIIAVEKISFGRGNIGKELMKKVVNAINVIHKSSYDEQTFIGKCIYRFLWHLY